MSNDRLNAALHSITTSSVTPELISDDMIKGLSARRSPRALWWLTLGVGLVAGYVIWFNVIADEGARQEPTNAHHARQANAEPPTPSLHQNEVLTGHVAGSETDFEFDDLDPNSILVLGLRDDELTRLGIIRDGDTIITNHQSLVCQSDLAQSLGIDRETLSDSGALFTWRNASTATAVNQIQARRYDGHEVSPSAVVWTSAFDAKNMQQPVYWVYPAMLSGDNLERIQNSVELHRLVSAMSALVVTWESILPTQAVYPRSIKPILIAVPFPNHKGRLVVYLMPTKSVLQSIPRRFHSLIHHCYDTFVPDVPRIHVPALIAKGLDMVLRPRDMNEHPARAGRVDLDLDRSELLNIGIATDSASVYTASGSGFTIDELLAHKANVTFELLPSDSAHHLRYVLGNMLRHQWQDGRRMFADTSAQYPMPLAINVEVQTEPHSDAWQCISGQTLHWLESTLGAWGVQHPRTTALARRLGNSLAFQHQSVDSVVMLEFNDDGVQLPVDRLLVPIKVATPWLSQSYWGGMRKRLVLVAWYFPNDMLFARLPKRIREFIKPEYLATLAYVEDQLTSEQLCSLLDKPSAFGLCSIGDTTLRIDAIGPIPAREFFTVFMQSAISTTASIKLISDDGRTALERSQIKLMRGANQIPIQLVGLNIPQGAYTVVVACAEGTRTSRVIIATP